MVLMRGSTGSSGGTSHSSIWPISAGVRLLTRRTSHDEGETVGGRPATVSHTLIAGQPPPGFPSFHRQNEGPPGVCTSGPPSIIVRHRRGSPSLRAAAARLHHAASTSPAYQPALPDPLSAKDRTIAIRARSSISSPPFLWLRVDSSLVDSASASGSCYQPALPPPPVPNVKTIAIRRTSSISHLTEFGFAASLLLSLPRPPSRAPDVDWLEQPPCHLHDRQDRKASTNSETRG